MKAFKNLVTAACISAMTITGFAMTAATPAFAQYNGNGGDRQFERELMERRYIRRGGHHWRHRARDWHRDRDRDWRRHGRRHHRHWRDRDDDAGIALGLGLAVGALAAGAIANSQPRYVVPSGSLQPWTRAWYNYCDNKYRSFNPRTGTYRGYDGQDHFCVVP